MKSIDISSIQKLLFENQDLKYKEFHQRLIPTVSAETVIGVRIPTLRKIAKYIYKNYDADEFLNTLPHTYYEENNLHAFLIEYTNDFEKCLKKVKHFLPYIDNWATCDSLRPKVFAQNKTGLISDIRWWTRSGNAYTVRFAIEMLMVHYLDKDFDVTFCDMISDIESDEYYVNMMIAWYFATALSKQWDLVFPYIKSRKLSVWIHNKTIQKALESYRITSSQKDILRRLKIK